MREVRCAWPVGACLGEGPVWVGPERALWFVDIKGPSIHRFDPATGQQSSWHAPDQVGFVLPLDDGGMVAGLPGRLARFTPSTGAFEPLVSLTDEPAGNRLNDATVDVAGRLWFGSMDDAASQASGVLYRWDGDGNPVLLDSGFIISNGPAHAPDGSRFYHTDSIGQTIYQYDVTADGAIYNKQPFIKIEAASGVPDGTIVDAEGCLWTALYGGSCVRRYSPAGELLESVALPCAHVTKMALGGPNMTTAFVTTAQPLVTDCNLGEPSFAGGLFVFEADVPGLPSVAARVPMRPTPSRITR